MLVFLFLVWGAEMEGLGSGWDVGDLDPPPPSPSFPGGWRMRDLNPPLPIPLSYFLPPLESCFLSLSSPVSYNPHPTLPGSLSPSTFNQANVGSRCITLPVSQSLAEVSTICDDEIGYKIIKTWVNHTEVLWHQHSTGNWEFILLPLGREKIK